MLNLTDFQSDLGDGVTDSFPALEAVRVALPAGGGAVLVPAGSYPLKSLWALTKPMQLVGEGIDATRFVHAAAGTTFATRGTLNGAQTLAGTGNGTLNLDDATNFPVPDPPTTATIFISNSTDGSVYPYARATYTGKSGNTLTGINVVSGGGSYPDDAVVVRQSDTIQVAGTSGASFSDLTIDASAAIAGSGVYGLHVLSSASHFSAERIKVIGQTNYSFAAQGDRENWGQTQIEGPNARWLRCRSGVRFYGFSATDCVAEGGVVEHTAGQATGFSAENGAHRAKIRGNHFKNTTILNSDARSIFVRGMKATLANTPVTLPASSISVTDANDIATWPTSGEVYIAAPAPSNLSQKLRYTAKSGATLTLDPDEDGLGTFPANSQVILPTDDCEVSGNSVEQSQQIGIYAIWARRLSVSNNKVFRSGRLRADGGQAIAAIQLNGSIDCDVGPGNVTRDQGGYGIALTNSPPPDGTGTQLYLGGRDCRAFYNTLLDCGDPALTFEAINDCRAYGNYVARTGFGFSVGEGSPWGFSAQAPCRRITLEDNDFADCDWAAGYIQSSSDCIVRRNRFHNCGWNRDRQDERALVVLYDGFNSGVLGSVGNLIEGNVASRDGRALTRGTAGDLLPSGAELPYHLPPLFARDKSPTGNAFTTLSAQATHTDTEVQVANQAVLPAASAAQPGRVFATFPTGGAIMLTYTGKATGPDRLTGVTWSTTGFTLPSGTVIADTFWPTLRSGYNVFRDNRFAGIARGLAPAGSTTPGPVRAQTTSDAAPAGIFGPYQDINGLDTAMANPVTGTVAADTTDKIQGTASTVITAATGQSADAAFDTTAYDYGLLNEDAFVEVAVKLGTTTNLNWIRFGVGLPPNSYTDFFSSGQIPRADLEPAGQWFRLRFRKGDMQQNGTLSWGTGLRFHARINATGGGTAEMRVDELRVCRAG